MVTKSVVCTYDCRDDVLRFNSIGSIELLGPKVYIFGMKNGKLEVVDTRAKEKALMMTQPVHKNGISHVKVTNSKKTFITNGRDSKILLFDIRRLGLNHGQGYQDREDFQSHPIFEFKDHESENYNITPCLLENQKYIVTGSLDNLLYFYDLETGLLSHHIETDSSFIAGVYDFSSVTHK